MGNTYQKNVRLEAALETKNKEISKLKKEMRELKPKRLELKPIRSQILFMLGEVPESIIFLKN